MGFGLFQVFLALLIEGLNRASDERNEATTVAEDVSKIVEERLNSLSRAHFSDRQFRDRLEARKAGLPNSKHLNDIILSTIHADAAEDQEAIFLPGGQYVNRKDFQEIFDLSDSLAQSSGPEYSMVPRRSADDQVQFTMASEDDVIASEIAAANRKNLIRDIIYRVSDDFEAPEVDDNELVMKILKLEDILRSLVMFRGHGLLMDHVARFGRTLIPMAKKMLTAAEYFNFVKVLKANDGLAKNQVSGKLDVTVIEAANLPRMDLLQSVDAYCVLFMAPASIQRIGFRCNASRTKTVKNNHSPQWMEQFSFDIEREDEYFVLTVFDSDKVTSDDLVGCVVVPFRALSPGEAIDNWFEIELYKSVLWERKRPKIHLKLQFIQQRAEANLDGLDELPASSS